MESKEAFVGETLERLLSWQSARPRVVQVGHQGDSISILAYALAERWCFAPWPATVAILTTPHE
jgi:hypothetical protein